MERGLVSQSEQPETRIFPANSWHHGFGRSGDPGTLGAAILFAMGGMDARQGTERQEPPKVGEIGGGSPGTQSSMGLSSGTGHTGSVNQRFFRAVSANQ